MMWTLPEQIELASGTYDINADYRDVIEVMQYLDNPDYSGHERRYIASSLFYEDFDSIPDTDWGPAAAAMMVFINCGYPVATTEPAPKEIDWEQDQWAIAADINKVAGAEIRSIPFLHWWTFVAYLNGVQEGQLSNLVAIRGKLREKKPLEKWEKEFYRNNKQKVDLIRPRTAEEEETQRYYKRLLGET